MLRWRETGIYHQLRISCGRWEVVEVKGVRYHCLEFPLIGLDIWFIVSIEDMSVLSHAFISLLYGRTNQVLLTNHMELLILQPVIFIY